MGIIGSKIGIIMAIIIFIASIQISNDGVAVKTAKGVKAIKLPDSTEYVEMFSEAGKLTGCGNGMQYLGGILIKSELSLEDLQSYYSDYAQNEWECIVERQTDKNIRVVEHGTVSLNTDINSENFYIVYSWGENNSIYSTFSTLDIRGH